MNAHLRLRLKQVVGLLLAATLLTIAGSGCRTANGFGKDMEKVGEKIQDGTN